MQKRTPNILFFKKKQISDDLICVICFDVLVDARKLECAHNFCYDCIIKWTKKGKECPICRRQIKKNKLQAASEEISEINNLKVMCHFKNCPWIGPLKELDKHEELCSFNPLKTEKKILKMLPKYDKGEDNGTPMVSLITKLFPAYPELTKMLLTNEESSTHKRIASLSIEPKQKKIDDFLLKNN